MNKYNKGFTMVEMIAAITIMGILCMAAIPSIFSMSEKNKKNTYVNDAKRLISIAKEKYKSDTTIKEVTSSNCLIFRLKDLDITNAQKGPSNGKYDNDYTYVTIRYNGTKYTYGVQLVEKIKENSYRGIKYTTNLEINSVSDVKPNVNNFTTLASITSSTSANCPNAFYIS